MNPKGDNDNNLLDDEMDMEEIEDDMPDVQEYHWKFNYVIQTDIWELLKHIYWSFRKNLWNCEN